ncbi:helicase-associated domain-containing protein [Rhodococcus sp. ARC_M12]|uniref:helicase-associated domain-containing protein n=1 Tax=Rhodococcus sp. ARC_M12 TaxID=2928854 RepID=UPI001FB1DE98|nr:helicase-associated domain-containing protein [Rhodococcus sp. ARC_M12]MCJ0977417.1 helicase-associated domain-containing protein [Rhodococcus sp. ARC_M12]
MTESIGTYEGWLASLDEDALTDLLHRRPDVATDPPPRSFGLLAQLLGAPARVPMLPRRLDSGSLALLELFALMGDLSRAEIGHWASEGSVNETPHIDAALATLTAHGLIWPHSLPGAGTVEYSPIDLSGVFSHPFGLARRQRKLFLHCAVEQDRLTVLSTLGIDPALERGARADAVAAAMTPARIRALFDGGSEEMRAMLCRFVDGKPVSLIFDIPSSAGTPAFERGLLYRLDGHRVEMPLEVSIALRGDGWRLPIDLTPPTFDTRVPSPDEVQRSRSIALLQFCEHTQALLTAIDTDGLTMMKTGGISAKVLRSLTNRLGFADEHDTALMLMLAREAGLLAERGTTGVTLTSAYETWSTSTRAEQAATLVAAWWSSPFTPTHRVPRASQKTVPALKKMLDDPAAADLRATALTALLRYEDADSPATVLRDSGEFAQYLDWHIPVVSTTAGPGHVHALWLEAGRLGIVADGAPTDLCRTLTEFPAGRDGDPGEIRAVLTAQLQDMAEWVPFSVRLLPDSTAVVTGPPSTEVASILGAAAQPESRDVASVWRFTPATIRGFFDTGGTGDQLIDALTEMADTDVPQALGYTIRDCWRSYGALAVRRIPCAIVSEDVVLLTSIETDESLAVLRFERLAPTVLVSSATPIDTIAVLRRHGYSPVRHSDTGQLQLDSTTRIRAEASRSTHRAVHPAQHRREPRELARLLLAGTSGSVDEARVRSALGPLSRLLPRELDLLTDAAARGTPVSIDYQNSKGAIVRHAISDALQDGHWLYALSESTGSRESFAIMNIRAVSAGRQ